MSLVNTPIETSEILALIDVRKPYFALENLQYQEDGSIIATIPIEQHLGYEPQPITSAEGGRHLAVLGSCVCAWHNPNKSRHYYLASSANATRVDLDFSKPSPKYFIGWAKCIKIEGKSAQAHTQLLYPDGTLYSEVYIDYHVLNHRIFERIHQARVVTATESKLNPYIEDPILNYKIISDKELTAVIDNIKPTDCAGHFYEIPAVPISLLFRVLVKLSINLMQTRTQNLQTVFCVKECTTEAKNLAFPGEKIDIVAQFIYTDEKNYHYIRTSAYTNCNCCVGVIDIILFEAR